MNLQKFEETNQRIREAFQKLKKEHPERLARRIDMSYCCQTFGWEPIPKSIERLARYGYKYVELPGQYGGPDVGPHTKLQEILAAMEQYDVKCSGVCMFMQPGFAFNDKNYFNRQRAVDYLRGIVQFAEDVGGQYCLITPAACTEPLQDGGDWLRSASVLHDVGHIFTDHNRCSPAPLPSCRTSRRRSSLSGMWTTRVCSISTAMWTTFSTRRTMWDRPSSIWGIKCCACTCGILTPACPSATG